MSDDNPESLRAWQVSMNNSGWVMDNYATLVKKYPEQYVIIHNCQVADHGKNLKPLLRHFRSNHESIKEYEFNIEFLTAMSTAYLSRIV